MIAQEFLALAIDIERAGRAVRACAMHLLEPVVVRGSIICACTQGPRSVLYKGTREGSWTPNCPVCGELATWSSTPTPE